MDLFAVDFLAVAFLAGALLAVDFFAVALFAVDFFAVDFLAAGMFTSSPARSRCHALEAPTLPLAHPAPYAVALVAP